MKELIQIVITLTLLVFMGGVAQAQFLFGAANGEFGNDGPSTLFVIDPTTGASNAIGPIGFTSVTGMAFLNDGRLVASANGDDICGSCAVLIEINRKTGVGTLIGEMDNNITGDCARFPDITYDTTTDTLYAISGSPGQCVPGRRLHTVNTTTGAATPVGVVSGFGGGGNGLAKDPITGALYFTPQSGNSLVILDPVTGAGTSVPGSEGNVAPRINALDFSPEFLGTQLYGSLRDASGNFGPNSASYLVIINIENGQTALIGPTAQGLDAIVFQTPAIRNVPTLSEWGLIAMAGVLGIVGFIAMRKRYTTA